MRLEALRPWSTSFAALLRRASVTLLRLAVCVACCFQASRCGAAYETRRAAAIARPLPSHVQGRGELWLRCPESSTWYSYDGDPRDWRERTEER